MSRGDLIARLEAATADQQRELLIEAFEDLHPYPGTARYLADEIDWTWDRLRDRFMRMLDAEAYESAALTLVPKGWTGFVAVDADNETWLWPEDGTIGKGFRVSHKIPAMGLCIAALRAKGGE